MGIYIANVLFIAQSTSMSTLLATAARDIGGLDIFSLYSTISGACVVVYMALFGFMAARKPAQKTKIMAFSCFLAAASLLVRAIAPSMEVVIVTAVAYPVISSAVFCCGYSLIRDMSDVETAGFRLGLTTTLSSVGMLAGPVLLGMVADFFGWRLATHVMWPIAVLAGLCVSFGARITDEEGEAIAMNSGKFDVLGTVGITVFSIPLVLFITLGGSRVPFGSPLSWVLAATALVGLFIVIFDIRKKGNFALIPTVVLKDRSTLLITAHLIFAGFSGMAVTYFIPTYVLYGLGGNAAQSGLSTTLTAIVGIFLAPYLGKQLARTMNGRGLLTVGAVARCAVMLTFILLISPSMNIIVLYLILFLYGICNCINNIGGSAVPQLVLKPEIRVSSNSFLQVCKTFGTNMGTAAFGAIIAVLGVVDGIKTAFWVSMAGAALSLIFAVFIKNPEVKKAD